MESKEVISDVRKIINAHFLGRPYQPNIQGRGGVFVTLKKDGKLRSCIGTLLEDKLTKNLRAAAIGSLNDPRFEEVKKDEFEKLSIEVSIIKNLKKSKDPLSELIIGKHGLLIVKEGKGGILLPQVAIDFGFSKEEFLDAVCEKAKLPKASWKNAEISLFEVDLYEE